LNLFKVQIDLEISKIEGPSPSFLTSSHFPFYTQLRETVNFGMQTEGYEPLLPRKRESEAERADCRKETSFSEYY